jgi:hypothetical protein
MMRHHLTILTILTLLIRLARCALADAASDGEGPAIASFGGCWPGFDCPSSLVVVDLHRELLEAACAGHAKAVKRILGERILDPSFDDSIVMRVACERGHRDVVTRLLRDGRVDPTAAGNDALRRAVRNGHHLVAILLLFDGRVHRSLDRKEALLEAIWHGHGLIVQLLLADWRLDPSFDGALPLTLACYLGHAGIAGLLLADGRVRAAAEKKGEQVRLGGADDPGAGLSAHDLFLEAVKGGHAGLVRLLLEGPNVGDEAPCDSCDSSDDPGALVLACRHGHPGVVRVLLASGRFDPSADRNRAIQEAARKGHAAVVALLLGHPKVDPSARRNRAIRRASEHGHAEAVRVLLADGRVDPSAAGNAAMRKASERGHAAVAELLLAHPRVDPRAARFGSPRRHKAVLRLIGTVLRLEGVGREALGRQALAGLSRRELAVLAARFAEDPEVAAVLAAHPPKAIDLLLRVNLTQQASKQASKHVVVVVISNR